jgi:hypothetical protein
MMRSQYFAKLAGQVFRRVCTCAGLALVLLATSSAAWAGGPPPPSAPEIDPGTAVSALALLTGSMFVLTDRLRRK